MLKKLTTLVQLTGVQEAADHELRVSIGQEGAQQTLVDSSMNFSEPPTQKKVKKALGDANTALRP